MAPPSLPNGVNGVHHEPPAGDNTHDVSETDSISGVSNTSTRSLVNGAIRVLEDENLDDGLPVFYGIVNGVHHGTRVGDDNRDLPEIDSISGISTLSFGSSEIRATRAFLDSNPVEPYALGYETDDGSVNTVPYGSSTDGRLFGDGQPSGSDLSRTPVPSLGPWQDELVEFIRETGEDIRNLSARIDRLEGRLRNHRQRDEQTDSEGQSSREGQTDGRSPYEVFQRRSGALIAVLEREIGNAGNREESEVETSAESAGEEGRSPNN